MIGVVSTHFFQTSCSRLLHIFIAYCYRRFPQSASLPLLEGVVLMAQLAQEM